MSGRRESSNGLQSGNLPISVIMEDYWVTNQQDVSIQISNAPPRLIHLDFSPDSAFRGDEVQVHLGAYDGHGIKSVSVNLQSMGGSMVELSPEPVGSVWEWQHNGDMRSTEITTWSGSFHIPQVCLLGGRISPSIWRIRREVQLLPL